jgi:hypothetical protein
LTIKTIEQSAMMRQNDQALVLRDNFEEAIAFFQKRTFKHRPK